MSNNTLKTRALLGGLLYSLVVGSPLYADDTEVFFGSPPSASTVHPNVLFILDSSGSMSASVPGTSLNRMENMKLALHGLLNSVTNVNIGLMRFNNPGGPILFPVSYVDEDMSTAAPETPAGSVTATITESSNDAEEVGGSMIMSLASKHLEMAYGASTGGQTTAISKIDNRYGDLEESLFGGVSKWGYHWNMENDQINGLRFKNMTIPPFATINSAKIKFTAVRTDSNDIKLRFFGDDQGNSPQLNEGDPPSNRVKTTAAVTWEPAAWVINAEYYSPDVSPIVQEVISRSDWDSGNPITFIETYVSGSGFDPKRRAHRYRSSASKAAELEVTYTVAPPEAQKVGLRFENVAIPQGATILSAAIEFTAAQTASDAVTLTVKGMDDDDAVIFGSGAGDISMRAKTANSVDWVPGAWIGDETYQTADLSVVVQEITDRTGWCGNNAMAFEITSPDVNNRAAYSYDGDPSKAPVLKITYDPDSVPASGGCINEWLYYRVDDSNDDAEEYNNGYMSLTSTVFNITSSQTNGVRFKDLRINQGALILDARLQLTAKSSNTGDMTITLKGEDSGNSHAFSSSAHNISSRPTAGTVDWSPTNWSTNSTYESPNIKSLIQGIVNHASWLPGNDLALIVEASGSNHRRAYTYNSSAGGAALLKMKVQFGGVFDGVTYTVRDKLRDLVDTFTPGGYTPIVDTLYEAAQYYRGSDVLYGKTRGNQQKRGRLSHLSSYTGGTVDRDVECTDANLNATACYDENITGAPVYKTPIVDQCQSSHIVLLTDGQANSNHSESLITALTGGSCASSDGGEKCGRELVEWMATTDQSADDGPLTLSGKQSVRTYTIGFNLDEGGQASAVDFLKDLARVGDGEYHSASTAAELTTVFQNIIREILSVDTTFVSPGATVNQFNRLAHRNEVYFSLFKPSDSTRWQGNMKRYGLYGSDTEVTRIVDVNGSDAVDSATGQFKTTAQSWWSAEADGNSIVEGGAASVLPTSASRNLITNAADLSILTLHEATTDITKAMLSIDGESDAYRETLIKWARGIDVKDEDNDGDSTEDRMQMGDPLHSRPIIITYGGTDAEPDSTVFVSTNDGFLHAINTTTGVEEFAFIPQELLANLNGLYINSAAVKHTYGLDGQITAWVNDANNDLVISKADGDSVYIYFGMRRGGRFYYALDVTDRAVPTMKWKIQGGVAPFEELAQTWSAPLHAKIDVGGTVTDVLIFAGGYDTGNDTNTVRTPDAEGRAIYIVNADTGALIWSGGSGVSFTKSFTDMVYSIPSDISIIDIDLDGKADQLYVGDMGAQLWRFDIHHGQSGASLVSGAVIADLGGSTAEENRKFYYAPDVALHSKTGYQSLSLSIGSGWRAHPLDTVVEDRFYNIRLTDIYGPPLDEDGKPDYPLAYTETSLYDATANLIGEGDATEKDAANASLEATNGWYIRLEDDGEKVLSNPITFQGSIFFTTYAPLAPASACSAALGGGYLYIVNAWDATPVMNLDGLGDLDSLTKDDRRRQLGRMGIPPSPQVMMPDEGGPVILVGPETYDPPEQEVSSRIYWREIMD